MSDPFVAEVAMFAGNFAPRGWAFCNGQLMSISQNTALFSLLGTTYGGDGRSNFALPNLQGAVPVGAGNGPGLTPRGLGETGGSTTVTLLASELPGHTHNIQASSAAASTSTPSPAVMLANAAPTKAYGAATHLARVCHHAPSTLIKATT